jgi:hypothetical protein
MGYLGVKLSESDDKQLKKCHPTSFFPLKTFGHKSIKNDVSRDSSTTVGMTKLIF